MDVLLVLVDKSFQDFNYCCRLECVKSMKSTASDHRSSSFSSSLESQADDAMLVASPCPA